MIHVKSLSYRRDDKVILDQIDWTVKAGEHWAIVGANGSGKTTLLKLLTGYEWASEGVISVLDRAFGSSNIHEVRKEIGWVSASLDQRYQMYEEMPCVDVIVSGVHASIGVYEAISEANERRAIELARAFGLEKIMFSPLRQLSQGERKKAFLARSLMNQPALLILDEATSGLDLFTREQLLMQIEGMLQQKKKPTLLYVTHYPEEIMPSVTHVLLLKNGQVLASGSKTEVMTAELVGEALGLPVTLEWADGRPWVKPKN